MTTQLHNQNKPSAVATLLRESVDKPSAVGSFIMQEEIWKDIEGYEGYYQVSSYGNVKRLDTTTNSRYNCKRKIVGRIIKMFLDYKGYYRVCLCVLNKKKTHQVHRLVAKAFIPNPENKPQVNHIDYCRTNNVVSNLQWNTSMEDNVHSYERRMEGLRLKKYRKCIAISDSDSISFNSLHECALHFNPKARNGSNLIRSIKSGRKYRGFVIKYLDK